MKNKLLLLTAISIFYLTDINAQLKILSGIEKGSYNAMAKDMSKICGDKETIDTVKEKIPVYNSSGLQTGDKDTMYIRRGKETFINIKTSGGSSDNYRQLVINRSTNIDVTFMQFDVLLLEQLKKLKRGEKKEDNVRILLPLGTEQIHLVTRANNEMIDNLKDLKFKRVGIGTKQSGTQVTAMCIQEITGIQWVNLEWDMEQCLKALFNGQLDAFFFVGAAPVTRLNELSSLMKYEIKLVPIEDENLLAYYSKSTIKKGTYPWLKEDINTFGVYSTLVTNIQGETKEKQDNLKKLLSDIKNNIDNLKKDGHPEWLEVDFNFDKVKSDWKIHDVAKEVFNVN